ncbi:mitochondrial ribosomal protein S18C [Lycorma delicatula]|uniref:mitochondrial ribosomal protein S18C n=1 Tax=Lycorma delicatula TaxID=130591 RepID=UPI003F50DDAA
MLRLLMRRYLGPACIHTSCVRQHGIRHSSSAENNTLPSISDDMPIEMKNPFEKEKQQCILCKMQITPDFKNVKLLSQFVSPYTGQIYGRHITGLCRHKQQQVEKEIRKAQSAGFMAIALKELVFMRDPKLFDPDRPFRPHKY